MEDLLYIGKKAYFYKPEFNAILVGEISKIEETTVRDGYGTRTSRTVTVDYTHMVKRHQDKLPDTQFFSTRVGLVEHLSRFLPQD